MIAAPQASSEQEIAFQEFVSPFLYDVPDYAPNIFLETRMSYVQTVIDMTGPGKVISRSYRFSVLISEHILGMIPNELGFSVGHERGDPDSRQISRVSDGRCQLFHSAFESLRLYEPVPDVLLVTIVYLEIVERKISLMNAL